jgi:hypothetical protein
MGFVPFLSGRPPVAMGELPVCALSLEQGAYQPAEGAIPAVCEVLVAFPPRPRRDPYERSS